MNSECLDFSPVIATQYVVEIPYRRQRFAGGTEVLDLAESVDSPIFLVVEPCVIIPQVPFRRVLGAVERS